ncbi:SAC domain-containing protein 8 isoform X2 [Wolffia australiana]
MEVEGVALLRSDRECGFERCAREIRVEEFVDKFVFKSVDPVVPDASFSVDRDEGVVRGPEGNSINSETLLSTSIIYGVLGTIKLLAGTYILVITSREETGTYCGVPVYYKRDEAYFVSLLRTVESTSGLYYSYDGDLTLNVQRAQRSIKKPGVPLWKKADPRFIWNRILLEDLIESKLDVFCITVVQGSFHSVDATVKGLPAKLSLISRRCTWRLGTRMWRRGADLEGNVANFVETEQVFEFEGFISSFMVVRGSVPLIWEQIVDLSYKPRLNIINHPETSKVVKSHFQNLSQRYGQTVAVDLTDKEGDEGQLSTAFAAEMENNSISRYVSFDFHQFCANGDFHNLERLYDLISSDFEKQGYFLQCPDGQIAGEQSGIIRVNCIDCLDRTNVTQSYMGKKSLDIQLHKIGVLSSDECISTDDDLYEKFRLLWATNGDDISLEYSGTPALKGDLVRYGRQTIFGMLKDGLSALSRYYLNNFQDGLRQDALDLISGHYLVHRNNPSLFQVDGFESLSYLPVACAVIVGGISLTTIQSNPGRQMNRFSSSVLWAALSTGVLVVVKVNGRQLCSRPRLCKLV